MYLKLTLTHLQTAFNKYADLVFWSKLFRSKIFWSTMTYFIFSKYIVQDSQICSKMEMKFHRTAQVSFDCDKSGSISVKLDYFWKIGENKFSLVMEKTVKHLTLGLVRLVTLNLINKIQDYGRAICSTSFTVTRKWTVTPISFYEIIEFYQNQVSTVAITYVIYLYSPRRKIMMIISKISNQTDWISTIKIEIGLVMVKLFELWLKTLTFSQ